MSSKNIESLTPDEERLLNIIMDLSLRDIKPRRIDHTIIYTGLEDLTNELGVKSIKTLLRSLSHKGYLKEKIQDSVITCPNCESIGVQAKYSCPQCESINLHKVQFIEHPFCGYIGNRNEFESENELICPKCKTHLGIFIKAAQMQGDKNKAIRVIGSSYECDKCGSKFEKPTIIHLCEQCGKNFNYREANYEKIPSFEITQKADDLAPNRFINDELRKVEKLLTDLGYIVDIQAQIKGKSGILQHFDLSANKNGALLLLDVSPWGKQADLISLMGKRTDVESQSIILLDLAGNPDLASLAKPYNITVLNGKNEGYLETLALLIPNTEKKKEEKHGRSFNWRGKK